MNRKIWKALGIAVCMLALAAPRAMAKTYEVWTSDKFAEAVQEINNKSSDTKNEIVLCDDIELTSGQMLTRGETTIKSKDENRKISIKDKNAGITVAKKGTVLNLVAEGYKGTLTIDGDTKDGSVSENPRVAFVSVLEGATANMYGNVTLQNWKSTGNACVVIMGSDPVTGSNSVFNMHGGVIEECSRAVTAGSKATFNMSGGEIRNCGGGRGSGNGGGVRVYGATFVMSGGTISGCTANEGGGLCAEKSSTVTISGGTISGCTASAGGGLYADNSTINITGGIISGCEGRWGGGLYATNQSTITINNGTISGCTAKEKGGGLYATNQSTINITGGIISGCKASLGVGGGLYAENSSTITISDGTISGSTISGCTASAGGGLYATNSSEITISDSTIKGNEAAFSGGGLYADNSTITITDGTISKCTAPAYNGGGLYANNSTITITGGTISGCEGGLGGGLYAEDSSTHSSTVTISDVTISGCKAGAGGGLYVVGLTLNIEGGTISGCFVSDSGKGGGLFADQSTLTISGGRIENNKAAYGGGVALRDSKVKKEDPITNWTVVGNKAYKTDTGMGYIGGGIYLENGSMDVSNGSNKIYNNTADGHGADICLTDDTSSIKLPNAANMGAKYLDSGIYIDNWYKDDNPRHKPSESGEVVDANKWLNGGLSLVASYKADPVHIEIDTNGGKGGSGSQTVQKGTTVTLEAPTKEGHLFKGWKDEEKGNSYPAGEDGKVNITVNENMKLTAVWEARTFTVTYVLLNGETRTETAAYGQTVTLGEEPRTGYTFVGWKDGENVYRAGETITVTGDMTLTAEWKKLPSAENLPKTGDESPVLLWGAALAVSAAACFVLRRKK